MDAHDRPVRFVILVLYALAASQMVWSGAAYRLVMPELVPVLALTALLFWLFAAGQISWPRRRIRSVTGGNGAGGQNGGKHADGAGYTRVAKGHGGGQHNDVWHGGAATPAKGSPVEGSPFAYSSAEGSPTGGSPAEGSLAGDRSQELLRGVWLSGLLYALFALPAAAYLIDSVLR